MQTSQEKQTNSENEEVFYYRNDLVNIFRCENDATILNIKNNIYDVKSKIDFNIKDELKKYSWSVWNSNKSKNTKPYVKVNNSKKFIYLHQCVLHINGIRKPDDGKIYSVDHINRDTLDNRVENLRWATQSEQNKNKDKVARKYNARKLPDGIKEEDIPKYVTYNVEIYGKEKRTERNFFRIEKHPSKIKWASSKSNRISIQDKLAETYHKLRELGDTFENVPECVKLSTRNPDLLAEEDGFTLTKCMMPKYVNFVRETEKRGCRFDIAIPKKKRVSTSGKKFVTLKQKYDEMKKKLSNIQDVD